MLTARFFRTETPNLVKFLTRSSSPQGRSTPYNVGSVLWRLFSTLEVVQYIGGITSVLWGVLQYCGGWSVQWGDSFRTVGDSFSTVEVVQYSGGITSVDAGG